MLINLSANETNGACVFPSWPRPASRSNRPDTYQRLPISRKVSVANRSRSIHRVTDWEPFAYFSTRLDDPAREGVTLPETYHLTETETGTELRYTLGQAEDADGNRSEISEQEAVGFLSEFWPACFDRMNAVIKTENRGRRIRPPYGILP